MKVLPLALVAMLADSHVTEPPTTGEAVEQIIQRSKTNPEALLELSGAFLDLIMKPIWELYSIGHFTLMQREGAKQAGEKREWLKTATALSQQRRGG